MKLFLTLFPTVICMFLLIIVVIAVIRGRGEKKSFITSGGVSIYTSDESVYKESDFDDD